MTTYNISMSPEMALSFSGQFFTKGSNGSIGQFQYRPLTVGMLGAHESSSAEAGALFYIMKGAIPTDLSAITNFSDRSADVLCAFDATHWSSVNNVNDFANSQVSVRPAIINSVYNVASQSGQATWFWWVVRYWAGNHFVNSTAEGLPCFVHQIAGTVGTSGSGADLELPSTDIISGQTYRVYNFRVQLPSTWTYTV